jgi:hypothetical protein
MSETGVSDATDLFLLSTAHLQLGQRLTLGRQQLQTMCPPLHCMMGGTASSRQTEGAHGIITAAAKAAL